MPILPAVAVRLFLSNLIPMLINQAKHFNGLSLSLLVASVLLCLALTMSVNAMSNPPAQSTALDTTARESAAKETQAIITNSAENFKRDANKQQLLEVAEKPIIEKNYLADIRVHSPQELIKILLRAEMLLDKGDFEAGHSAPVVFLLHGDEARVLFKNQYSQNKKLVDLAAKLSAFNVVDIKVCEVWMRKNSLDQQQLQPFVSPVGYAPAEQKRLIKEEQYQYF